MDTGSAARQPNPCPSGQLPSHPLHEPLSLRLETLLTLDTAIPLQVNALIERTEGKGVYLMMIVLCLPFITLLAVPGASSFLGSVIGLLALRLAMRQPMRLPRFIGERILPAKRYLKVIRGSVKLLRWTEKFIKPRNGDWLQWHTSHVFNSLLLVFMAFLLALPLPIPFTNTLPAYTIVLLSACMMEEDGLAIWLGYGMALTTTIYFYLWEEAIAKFCASHFGAFHAWLMRFL